MWISMYEKYNNMVRWATETFAYVEMFDVRVTQKEAVTQLDAVFLYCACHRHNHHTMLHYEKRLTRFLLKQWLDRKNLSPNKQQPTFDLVSQPMSEEWPYQMARSMCIRTRAIFCVFSTLLTDKFFCEPLNGGMFNSRPNFTKKSWILKPFSAIKLLPSGTSCKRSRISLSWNSRWSLILPENSSLTKIKAQFEANNE